MGKSREREKWLSSSMRSRSESTISYSQQGKISGGETSKPCSPPVSSTHFSLLGPVGEHLL